MASIKTASIKISTSSEEDLEAIRGFIEETYPIVHRSKVHPNTRDGIHQFFTVLLGEEEVSP